MNNLIKFIHDTFANAGFTEAVIAVSGGIDSALSCALTVKALGANHVYPLFLPYGNLNQKGVEDGKLVTSFLKIPQKNIQTINIQPMVDMFFSVCHPELGSGSQDHNPSRTSIAPKMLKQVQHDIQVRKGNIMARVRMIVVYDQAKKRKALVVGTENKTEHYLGYYTRFGDEASDLEPLRNLYKTQVYKMARELGIPEPILTKAPTAGLWEGQTDEGEFGFSYKEADEILVLYFDQEKTIEEIIGLGNKKDVVDAVIGRVSRNNFKHHLPFTP